MIRHIDLDQARGLVHYPYNCGKCLSDDICRGMVIGTYLCNCDHIDEAHRGGKVPYKGSTIRVNGRTYPIHEFVEMVELSLPKEEA